MKAATQWKDSGRDGDRGGHPVVGHADSTRARTGREVAPTNGDPRQFMKQTGEGRGVEEGPRNHAASRPPRRRRPRSRRGSTPLGRSEVTVRCEFDRDDVDGGRFVSKFFISRPIFACSIAILMVVVGCRRSGAAGRAVPRDRPADGHDHGELSRIERAEVVGRIITTPSRSRSTASRA